MLRGAAGARPVIDATVTSALIVAFGGTARHLELRSDDFGAMSLSAGSVGSDLIASNSSATQPAVSLSSNDTLLRDSVAVASGGASAVDMGGDGTAHVRNVTAIATGASSAAIYVHASSTQIPMSGCDEADASLTVDNVIARGTSADLSAEVTAAPCGSPSAVITASYSNFRTATPSGSGAVITQGAGNQTTSPQTDDAAIFADTTLYRQRETAPTHNAGLDDPSDAGYVDPDGHPRVGESHVDIGSDELPAPPGVVTGSASAVAAMSADVSGAVDGHGEGVAYRFEYGTTPALGSMTAEQTTDSTSLTSIQQALTSLPPQTTIYYRARARLDGPQSRAAVGDTKSFTTLPAFAPAVTTQPASGIGATYAMLHGLVNPMGYATTWQFDWGETASYGSSTAGAGAGAGTADVPVSQKIEGLTPNTRYHYRVQGTSQIATAFGSDTTFATKRLKIRGLKVKPKRFRMGSDLPKVAKVGTVIKFRLNGAAKVKLKFLRIKHGRLVPKGGFKYKTKAGKQRIRFEGRLSKKKQLKPGKYKLVVRAKTAGGKSKKISTKFRLLPKRR
jgi:hypothetical protein